MTNGAMKMYNAFETAQILGMKVRTVREWIYTGRIKAVKYDGGHRWYISEKEIERIQKGDSLNDNKD